MTQNQISYWRLVEDKRANTENEQIKRDTLEEQARHNRKQEDYNDAYLSEQERSHLANEALSLASLNESITSHRRNESLQAKNIEVQASHYAKEDALNAQRLNEQVREFNIKSPYEIGKMSSETSLNKEKMQTEAKTRDKMDSEIYSNYATSTAKYGDLVTKIMGYGLFPYALGKGSGGGNNGGGGKTFTTNYYGDFQYNTNNNVSDNERVTIINPGEEKKAQNKPKTAKDAGLGWFDVTKHGKLYSDEALRDAGSNAATSLILGSLALALSGIGGNKQQNPVHVNW